MAYNNLPETRLIVVKDGFVTFCRHFKYLVSWISFSLREYHNISKRIAAANTSIGAMSEIWDDDNVDTYSKYLLFRAIPCNLLLWGCESWALWKSLLSCLEVFLNRGDKDNIEGKYVSGIRTAHHKHLNKGKVLQHSNYQEPYFPLSADLP